MKQRLAILGSTGSIGVQTLDIARENPGRFEVRVLTANRNWERLARQAREFDADAAVIADKQHYAQLRDALAGTDTKVYAGEEAVAQVAAGGGTDVVVNALVGYAGLAPTVAAIEAGKKLALANKESLVVGGACVMPLARERKAPVIPIDSEHSAIFQCLVGERAPVRRLIVTCSGGAFRDFRAEELANVTVEQALRHPQWDMGAKITIDSSTLVNKGFEVIEAHWLFGTPAERISVLLHPQSIIHSMVEFEDGAIKAQLGTPDMRLPISFALLYPDRANRPGERFNFLNHPQLTFAEVDRAKYPALDIAYDCLRRGGTAACTMNGANEGVPRPQMRMARHRARHPLRAGARRIRPLAHPGRLRRGERRSPRAGGGVPTIKKLKIKACGHSCKNHSVLPLFHHPDRHSRDGSLHHGAGVQNPRREILHLLRPMVLAVQIQTRKHRVRSGMAAAGRICQDRRHDRRVDGHGTDETARQTGRVPRQTRLAAFSGDDRRRGDERRAGRGHLHRHLLHVGRHLFLERRRQVGLQLQRGRAQTRIPRRRPAGEHRRRRGGRHQTR